MAFIACPPIWNQKACQARKFRQRVVIVEWYFLHHVEVFYRLPPSVFFSLIAKGYQSFFAILEMQFALCGFWCIDYIDAFLKILPRFFLISWDKFWLKIFKEHL